MTRISSRIGAVIGAGLCALVVADGAVAQQFTMKIGTATINDTQHEWMKRFQKRMSEKAGQRLKVDLYPSGQLGAIPRMVEGIQLGTIESLVTPSVFLVGVDPRNQVVWAPAVFDDIDHCWRTIMDDRFRSWWFPLMDAKGITAISMMCTSEQAFLTKKDVRGLDDLKGLKIRVLASDMEVKPMQAIGVNPTPMPFSEVLPALQRNVIDGVSSIPILFNNMKMYNTAKHITIGGLFKSMVPVYVSKVWWDKLPKDLQGVMLAEARQVEQELIDWNAQANAQILANWKKNGGSVRRLSPEDQKQLFETVTPVVAKVVSSDPAIQEAYRTLMEIAAANK